MPFFLERKCINFNGNRIKFHVYKFLPVQFSKQKPGCFLHKYALQLFLAAKNFQKFMHFCVVNTQNPKPNLWIRTQQTSED